MSVGNPNHDPKTGEFTSGSGQGSSKPTAAQKVKGHLAAAGNAAIATGGALVGMAANHFVKAAVKGAAGPIRDYAHGRVEKLINKHGPRIEKAAAKHTKAVMKGVNAAFQAPPGKRVAAFKHGITAPSTRRSAVTKITPVFPYKG